MKTVEKTVSKDERELKEKATLAMIAGMSVKDKKIILENVYQYKRKATSYYFHF
ncbi:Uncharacterised protein [uncultured archaeon]|nr:Uncharacterised protein [uncultured archaeon]